MGDQPIPPILTQPDNPAWAAATEAEAREFRRQFGLGEFHPDAPEAERDLYDRQPPGLAPPNGHDETANFDETQSSESGPNDSPNLAPSPETARINAAELDTKHFEPVEWLIEGILPMGLGILAGKSKIGKSWLVLALAIAVASGRLALGKANTFQCDVLYLAMEDNQRRLQKRMRSLLKGEAAPERLTFAMTWESGDNGALERLDEYLEHHKACRMVIIDTFVMVRRRAGNKNENAYERDYMDMVAYRLLAQRHNVCILLVHHTKKQDASDVFDMISGTTGMQGAADTMMVLARPRGSLNGTFNVTGRDIVDDGEFAVSFDKPTGHWTILGQADEVHKETQKSNVLNYLISQEEPSGPAEIANDLGINIQTVKSALKRLKKAGVVENPASGLWQAKRNYP